MENYIKKINDRLIESGNTQYAKRVKFIFQLTGGLTIAIGLAGFLASFITFLVLFLKFKTDDAFIAWIVAVPFLVLIIIGSVLARIGDTLLPKDKTKYDGFKESFKELNFKEKSRAKKIDNQNSTQISSQTEEDNIVTPE